MFRGVVPAWTEHRLPCGACHSSGCGSSVDRVTAMGAEDCPICMHAPTDRALFGRRVGFRPPLNHRPSARRPSSAAIRPPPTGAQGRTAGAGPSALAQGRSGLDADPSDLCGLNFGTVHASGARSGSGSGVLTVPIWPMRGVLTFPIWLGPSARRMQRPLRATGTHNYLRSRGNYCDHLHV